MAITTVSSQAVTTAWTDLGVGPFLAVASNGRDLFQIADVVPPSLTSGGFHITPEFPWSSATTSHLWVIGIGTVIVSK